MTLTTSLLSKENSGETRRDLGRGREGRELYRLYIPGAS